MRTSNRTKTVLLSIPLLGLAAAPAAAALSASTVTDLNMRSGPGPQYQIESVIPSDAEVDVSGCLADQEWCEIEYNGKTGWAYSAYMTTPVEDEPVVLYQNRDRVEVNTVTYEDSEGAGTAAGLGGAWGAAAGSLLIGGPAAVAAGAVIGAMAGASSQVEEKTVTYVEHHPVEPVYLNGEVAEGAGIPQEITIHEVPDSKYAYLNVNEQMVIVDPETHRIVKVIR